MYCLYIWVENSNVSRETIVKMTKLFYTLLLFTVISCQSQKLISKIENGDLLFVETNYKNLSGAISRVTENKNNLILVAISLSPTTQLMLRRFLKTKKFYLFLSSSEGIFGIVII